MKFGNYKSIKTLPSYIKVFQNIQFQEYNYILRFQNNFFVVNC